MHIRCFLLSSLVACSGGGDGEITIHTPEGSFLVARNDGDAAWVAPEKVDATTFRFIATGPYRITQGCGRDESTSFIRQVARTLDDWAYTVTLLTAADRKAVSQPCLEQAFERLRGRIDLRAPMTDREAQILDEDTFSDDEVTALLMKKLESL